MSLLTPITIRILRSKLYHVAKADTWHGVVATHHGQVDGRRVPVVKPVGEPDAGKSQVRFDERRVKTGPGYGLRHRCMVKTSGNSYSPDLPPPRHSSTLLVCRSEALQGPSWQGLRPRPPQSYSCSTSRRPRERNAARTDVCGDAVDQR